MIEREKRWRVKDTIPSDNIKDKFVIEQTYAHVKPDVRIRKITRNDSEEFYHTVKYKLQNNEREEIEQKISKERYGRILDSINKKSMVKERTVVELENGLLAEVDKFKDTGDILVEVEFPTIESMRSFIKPDWFGSEIKTSKSFSYLVFAKINNINLSVWD
jgi:adenylate cyclase